MSHKEALTVEEYAKELDAIANQMTMDDFDHTVEIQHLAPGSERFNIRITVPIGDAKAELLLQDASKMPPSPSIDAAVRALWVSHQVHAYESGGQREYTATWKPLRSNNWKGVKIALVKDENPDGGSKLQQWKPKFSINRKNRSADIGFASRYVSLRAGKSKNA